MTATAEIMSNGKKSGERLQAQEGRAPGGAGGEPSTELGSVTAGLNGDIVSDCRAECPQCYK